MVKKFPQKRYLRKILSLCLALTMLVSMGGLSAFAVQSSWTDVATPGDTAEDVYYKWPFQNPNLPVAERVDDLIGRMTLDEKIALMQQFSGAIIRLGVPAFRTGSEGLHGVSWMGYATVFPQAVGIAATWNRNLMVDVGDVVGREMRAYNSVDSHFNGVDLWSPVVDLSRDPRAGRTSEHMGEDAYLAGQIATYYGLGMKGLDDPFYYMSIPTLKHLAAYDQEASRATYSANASPRVLYEYYFKPFAEPIKNGAVNGVMTGYNLINGKPTMTFPEMLEDLYGKWVPGGLENGSFLNVTDANSPANLLGSNAYYINNDIGRAKAYADSIKSGVGALTSSDTNTPETRRALYEALARGFLTEDDLDRTARSILTVRCHAGDLDADPINPYKEINKSTDLPDPNIYTGDVKEHPNSKIARQVAQEQVTLLKNEGNILPIAKTTPKVALTGPLTTEISTDFYGGSFPYITLIKDEVANKLANPGTQLAYTRGVDIVAFSSQASGTLAGANGKYLTAGDTKSSVVTVSGADKNDPKAQFLYFNYAHGAGQLKSVFYEDLEANNGFLENNRHFNNLAPGFFPPGTATQDWNSQATAIWSETGERDGTATPENGDTVRISLYSGTGRPGAGNNLIVTAASGTTNNNGTATSANNATKFTYELIESGKGKAAEAATGADVAIVCVGDQPHNDSRETTDRPNADVAGDGPISLSKGQLDLINAVAAVNANTVVVIVGSYAFDISSFKDNPNIKGIVYSTHAGQEQGRAIADVLFGDYAPAGRLHTTWYAGVDNLPPITDYDIIKGERTYMYHTADDILYPFGYGLTYADFTYADMNVTPGTSTNVSADTTFSVTANITNNAAAASDEVVQLYVAYKNAEDSTVTDRPIKELKGFDRIHVAAGASKAVNIQVPLFELAVWDVRSESFAVEPGTYTFMLGKSSEDIILTKDVVITGAALADRDPSKVDAVNWDDYSYSAVSATDARSSADIIPISVMEDDTYGIGVVKNKSAWTGDKNSWVQYQGISFNGDAGMGGFVTIRASNANAEPVNVTVLKGDYGTGEEIGVITIPPTGHVQTFVNVTAAVTGGMSGAGSLTFVFPVHNVYMKWFSQTALSPKAATSDDITVNTLLYTNVTTISAANTTTTLNRLHNQIPPVLALNNATMLAEAVMADDVYVDSAVVWSMTDTEGNATDLATIDASGAIKAAAAGSGTVRVTATYTVDDNPVSAYVDVEVKNLTPGAGGVEAIALRSGGDGRPGDTAWGLTNGAGTSNQYTNFGSIYQYQGALTVSAVTYPNDQGAARPVTFALFDESGENATDLAQLVGDGEAGFVEGLTSGNTSRAFNVTVKATGAGNGWVTLKATHEATGLSTTTKLYIDNQTGRDAFAPRIEGELFDDGSYQTIRGNGVRADNVHGDQAGMQVNGFRNGDWIVYKNYDFGANTNADLQMTFNYIKYLNTDATIKVYLDDTTNEDNLMGSFTVSGADEGNGRSPWIWKNITIDFANAAQTAVSGQHDIYLVFSGEKNNTNDVSKTYETVSGLRDFGINWFAIEGAKDVGPVYTLTVIPETLTATYAANVAVEVSVVGDETGGALTARMTVNDVNYETPVTPGTRAVIYIPVAANIQEGIYAVTLLSGENVVAQGSIEVLPEPTDLWKVNIAVEDGSAHIQFGDDIKPKTGGYKLTINGVTAACEQVGAKTLKVENVAQYLTDGENKFVTGGVKFVNHFPSYSFTFTTLYTIGA